MCLLLVLHPPATASESFPHTRYPNNCACSLLTEEAESFLIVYHDASWDNVIVTLCIIAGLLSEKLNRDRFTFF